MIFYGNYFEGEKGPVRPMKTTAPTKIDGAMRALRTVRVFCPSCQTLEFVKSVTSVAQRPTSYISTVVLECQHVREIEISVARPKSQTKEDS